MTTIKANLIEAEKKALELFKIIEERGLISPGKSEKELNTEIFNLAFDLFGINKYWHKRIVRSGANTLYPYKDNPPDLVIQKDDILFIDFGPVFADWEADFGRTYVVGSDPLKQKLKQDIESAWYETQDWFESQTKLTGAQLYRFVVEIAKKYGWIFGGEIAGHIIGNFPHEKLEPQNHNDMFEPDINGVAREWILEIHLVDTKERIGGFFEQLVT